MTQKREESQSRSRVGIAEVTLTPIMRVASTPPAIPKIRNDEGNARMALPRV